MHRYDRMLRPLGILLVLESVINRFNNVVFAWNSCPWKTTDDINGFKPERAIFPFAKQANTSTLYVVETFRIPRLKTKCRDRWI